jgi:hypothetical membrane protein
VSAARGGTAGGAAACWLVAGVAYPSLEAIAARAVPGYRYANDYISDLGRPDSPLSHLMNTAFVVQGVSFFVGAVLLMRAARVRAVFPCFAAANCIGNVVVASVPSGAAGTALAHVAGAVLAIVGGNAAIVAGTPLVRAAGAPKGYTAVSVAIAAVGLVSFVLLAVASTTSSTVVLPGAVLERTSVYTIIAWQVLSALALLVARRRL